MAGGLVPCQLVTMLLDTSGLLCLADDRDYRHVQAQQLFRSTRSCVVHNYILAEFIPLCQARRLNREKALSFLEDLLADARIELVWVDNTLHDAAFDLLRDRLDKTYSPCDAVSFLLMQEHGITEALSTDHHFAQEGFTPLLPAEGAAP